MIISKRKLKENLIIIILVLLLTSIMGNIVKIYASKDQAVIVPILMYHQVKNSGFGKDCISPSEFENDLKYLSDNNYNTITMNQLIDSVYNGNELPENPIILTFDDGCLSTYKYVFPLLIKYNMKIVVSIIGIGTDSFSKVSDVNINYSHATWDQINEMKNSGLVELQNHTYNLHKVCNGRIGCKQVRGESVEDYEKTLTEDILKCQDQIKKMTGSSPDTFTYPFGEVSENTNLIIEKLGFKASLSCTFGVNIITNDPSTLFELKRICRSHNQSAEKMIKDGMETLKFINY